MGVKLSIADNYGSSSSVDVVQGDVIYAHIKTNPDGTFQIPMPMGSYSLLIWKEGYIPQSRASVQVWPGQVFYTLLEDHQPGSSGLYQSLHVSSKNIPRKTIDPRSGLRGTMRLSESGIRKPGKDATILVGPDLRLDRSQITSPIDKVIGTRLIVQAQTNDDGEFFIPLPPGNYRLIAGKQGYIPHVFDLVILPPGVYNTTLMLDNQPGNSGRHQKLDLSGL